MAPSFRGTITILYKTYSMGGQSIASIFDLGAHMYRRHHVFRHCSLISSSCQHRLAYILYDHGYVVYSVQIQPSNLTHQKFAVHMPLAFSSGHTHCKLPLTSILRSYVRGMHHVTVIFYILHILQLALYTNGSVTCSHTITMES